MATPLSGDADRPLPAPGAATTVSPTQLRHHLRRLLCRHLDTDGYRPALTVLGIGRSRAEVLRREIDRPENAILGFVLPAHYEAVGIVASSVIATGSLRAHHDAALAIGVTRSGCIRSLLATNASVIDTKEPQGWLVDACLRSLGQPAPACTIPSLSYPVALWLDRLMVALLAEPTARPLTWSDAVRLCPVPRRWRSIDPVDLGTTLGSTTRSWKTLRQAAAQGVYSPAGVSADQAAWMDDPMFARWCMGSFPDIASLQGDVEFLAPSPVAERVALALRAARSAVGA